MDTRFLLAPDAYFGDDWYEREQEKLFARTWHLAAATDELAEPGDFVTIDAGHDPLVVVRGLDDELRAFHDFCPHRGIKLLVDSGNTRTGIVCPYHSWNFALDGTLRNVPQPEEFDPVALEDCGLVAASVGEWGGMVFVNGAPDADFTACLARLSRPHRQLPARTTARGRARAVRRPLQLEALRREPRRRVPPLVSPRALAERVRPPSVRVGRDRSALGQLRTGEGRRRAASARMSGARRSPDSTNATRSGSARTCCSPTHCSRPSPSSS